MKGYLKSKSKTFDARTDFSDLLDWVIKEVETSSPIDPTEEAYTAKRYRVQISEVEELDYHASKIIRNQNLARARKKLAERNNGAGEAHGF